jgi:hypothetical protein
MSAGGYFWKYSSSSPSLPVATISSISAAIFSPMSGIAVRVPAAARSASEKLASNTLAAFCRAMI